MQDTSAQAFTGEPVSARDRPPASLTPAFFLALGTFAIGTEGFMIAPLLPTIAADVGMSVPLTAMLVVVFTLVLALSSPVSTVLTGGLNRRNTLMAAMVLFTIGNLCAALSAGFTTLLFARILMAIAAGLFVPGANALAGATVAPGRRGLALAIVSGGMTIAIALGLPFGAVVGHAFGWRATFVMVAAMSTVALLGIGLGISATTGADLPVARFRERVSTIAQPAIRRLLTVSLFWSVGAYCAYPYIAPYLTAVLGFGQQGITATVTLWGISAAAGVLTGGHLNDRLGPVRVVRVSLAGLAAAFLLLSVASLLPARLALVPALAAVSVWGFTVWSFFPAQMARLIAAGPPQQGSVALSLNTSTMYLGFSIGSAIGAGILDLGLLWGIGALAGLSELVALVLDMRRKTP